MPHLSKYKTVKQTFGDCSACGQPQEKHCCSDYYRQRTIEPISYEEWLPNVRIAVSEEIDDDVLYDYIRRGCIEFAKKTTILRRNIELTLQDCVGDYYPCLGEQERIDNVRLLSIDGVCHEAIGDTCTWDVNGYKYWFHPPHTLEIHPMPRKRHKQQSEDSEQCGPCATSKRSGNPCDGDKVILTVVGVPREDSDSVDRIIFDRYFDAIENFAIAKASLLPLPTDERKKQIGGDLTNWRMREFKTAINQAKIDLARHYSVGGQTW